MRSDGVAGARTSFPLFSQLLSTIPAHTLVPIIKLGHYRKLNRANLLFSPRLFFFFTSHLRISGEKKLSSTIAACFDGVPLESIKVRAYLRPSRIPTRVRSSASNIDARLHEEPRLKLKTQRKCSKKNGPPKKSPFLILNSLVTTTLLFANIKLFNILKKMHIKLVLVVVKGQRPTANSQWPVVNGQ